MINYEYAELFKEDSVDKKWKIIATDYIGYGFPTESIQDSSIRPGNYYGKTYLDLDTDFFYRMENLSPYQLGWVKLNSEIGLAVIKNENIFSQSIEITESLCSEKQLRFGCCEASSLKFKFSDTVKSLKGMWLNVFVVLNHHNESPFLIGRYKVDSDKPAADKQYREVVAYDAMRDIFAVDLLKWWEDNFPSGPYYLSEVRESLMNYLGLREVLPDGGLANDNYRLRNTSSIYEKIESLKGIDAITSLCEANGCFGHIGRDGKFHYVYLQQYNMGLYPSNDLYPGQESEKLPQEGDGKLYPQDPESFEISRTLCSKLDYENFVAERIDKVVINDNYNHFIGEYQEETSSVVNVYTIKGNFFFLDRYLDDFNRVAKNIFDKISNISYRPFDADVKGNPCFEVGDAIRIQAQHHAVESYILSRTLKGGGSLKDSISAQGTEKYSN